MVARNDASYLFYSPSKFMISIPRHLFLLLILALLSPSVMAAQVEHVRMEGHVPHAQIRDSSLLGPLESDKTLDMVFGLPLRNQVELEQLISDLHNPESPQYGRYLSPEEFTDRFGPTFEDLKEVVTHLKNAGFEVQNTSPNRMLVHARANVDRIQRSFNIRLNRYRRNAGSFFSTAEEPRLPVNISSRIVHIAGLQNAVRMKPHFRNVVAHTALQPAIGGTGPRGGLAPQDIVTAYNLPAGAKNGQGQTLALFQMDGYVASDIQTYTNYFGLTPVPLENILVDGVSGSAGDGAIEVAMDIELMNAIAPGASRILVYEGPNNDRGILDTYSRIANDNRASVISTSWGMSEYDTGASFARLESQFFMQMAAQGQSFFAASGDSGAYDTTSSNGTPILTVDDPASQPFVTGVGGTRLNLGAGQSYSSEVVWNSGGGATGGGVSSIWSIPSWQMTTATLASQQMRNVPDVALNADPNTGYAIFSGGQWHVVGGTSAGAPLWAGYTGIINQGRAQNGSQVLGFANPTLYAFGNASSYGNNFHDITIGNNNFYSAGVGYDNTTGWGSFQGSNLITALTRTAQTVSFSGMPTSMIWGDSLNLTASASSGLSVSYNAGPLNTCTVSGAQLFGLYPGTCVAQALQSGSTQYAPASVSATLEVIPPTYPGVNRNLKVSVPTNGGMVISTPVGIACGDDGVYCSQGFTRNEIVTLTATPGLNHQFLGWSGTCHGKALTCRFKMTSNRVVAARFK